MVSSLLGQVETNNLLRKSKPAFFALQELSVMVRPPALVSSLFDLQAHCAHVEHVTAPAPQCLGGGC